MGLYMRIYFHITFQAIRFRYQSAASLDGLRAAADIVRRADASESSSSEALGAARGEDPHPGDAHELPVHRDSVSAVVHAAGLQVGADSRTDDAARRRAVHED